MNHPLVDDMKQGTCGWCGTEGLVFNDNGRCEQCDLDVAHCSVCDEDYHYENTCRHIFQDGGLAWTGAGIEDEPDDGVKASFLSLIAMMPAEFAIKLRDAILSGEFYTWTCMPIIGGGGSVTLNGFPARGRQFGSLILELGERDDARPASDGYSWMVSLYKRETAAANATTAAWLSEIIDDRESGLALARLDDDGWGKACGYS